MEATIYKIEVDKKDILFFEDFIKRMRMKVLDKEEKDPTKMSKEAFFAKIDNGLKEYEEGKTKEFKTFQEFQNYMAK